MFKDFAAGVDIQLSGKRLRVLMAYTHPGVPSSSGPELAASARPPEGAGFGAPLSPSASSPKAFLHSCYSSSTPPPYTPKFAHLGMAPLS